MANIYRHRWFDPRPFVFPVAASTLIEHGDLMYWDTTVAKPASALALAGTLAADQEAFHDLFIGVNSPEVRLAADTVAGKIVIGTGGVWEFDLRTALGADKYPGTLFGVNRNAGGTALMNQSVIEVATANLAIGRLATLALSGATKVLLEIVSTRMHGGVQDPM
jgi:hypothetical protein